MEIDSQNTPMLLKLEKNSIVYTLIHNFFSFTRYYYQTINFNKENIILHPLASDLIVLLFNKWHISEHNKYSAVLKSNGCPFLETCEGNCSKMDLMS